MNKIKLMILALAGMITVTGCGDFGDTNVDPNNPSKPDTRFLFSYACKKVPTLSMVSTFNPWTQIYPQYVSEGKSIQFTNFSQPQFATTSYYTETLRNLEGIIKLNTDEETKNESYVVQLGSAANQIAACRTLRALFYMSLTDAQGMIAYSEALKGDDANFTPKYDSQESIYTDLDKELTEAYAQFDASSSLDKNFDILYAGNISNWKKLNASIRMMMAIKLSDVAPGVGKERFAKAYADGGMTDNDEMLVYKYLQETANQNPMYDNMVVSGRKDYAPSKTILDQLLAYNDPRIHAYAVPNSLGEYKGVPFGLIQADVTNYKDCAAFAERYYQQNSPVVVISPSHILLIEAEAAVRGWINADPAELYKAGITASFAQYDDIDELKNPEEAAETYCAQADIKFEGTDAQKIEKIAMQRWLANFMQNGFEAWSDWRRLNVPKLKVGPNALVDHIPYRMTYSAPDYNTNMDNYNAAVAEQGPDNIETRVWWDVAPNN